MKRAVPVMAVVISLLFLLSAVSVRPVAATAVTGLSGAYWLGSFFGSPAPIWPNCPSASTPIPPAPAGSPSSTPPTVTEIDPNINFGSTTGFYWDESYPATVTTPPAPGYPGGFAVTQGGYGVASSSWGDKTLYTDYPTSTYFVDTDFSVEWTGYISLTAGTYYFQLESDDGSSLYINPTAGSSAISGAYAVINNYFEQPPTAATGSFTAASTGKYAIEVDYFETCDSQSGIDLSWSTSPTGGFTIIPTTAFTPAQIGSNAPVSSSVPEFGFAAPVIATVAFLALVLIRRRTLGGIGTTT